MVNKDTSVPETNIRPKTLQEYTGQSKIIQTLKLFLNGIKKRGFPSEHILFYGPPGIGKTTLAHVISHELGGSIKITSGAALQKGADIASILTNLDNNDILFIDEIHRLPKHVEEMLYPVLEEFFLDIIIGKGPSARTMRIEVPKITIIGATTKLAHLSAPLRDRFGLILRLDYYSLQEMVEIIKRTAVLLNLPIDDSASREIAIRSRKTPRIAIRMVKRARDLYDAKKVKAIDARLVDSLFKLLEIDNEGLFDIDLKYLNLIADKFQNTGIGIETIA